MKNRRERQLGAYRDGELSARMRQRVEQQLHTDPESEQELQRLEMLSKAVSEAWSEGPPAPAPGFLINALRPAMRRVDEELAARSLWRRLRERFADVLRPVPVTALAGTCAAALLLLLLGSPTHEDAPAVSLPEMLTLASPAAIYDLDQEEKPLLVYQLEDGVTVIWLLESEQGFSGELPRVGRWT